MINPERDTRYLEHLKSHERGNRILNALAAARVRAGEIVDRFTHEAHDKNPKFTYVLPTSGRLKPYMQTPEVFQYLPNPLKLPLFEYTQSLIKEKEKQGAIFDAGIDTAQANGVLFQTGHSRDIAKAAIFEKDENAVRVTGLEVFVSEVMKRAGEDGGAFHTVEYTNQEKVKSISLTRSGGSPELLPSVFDQMPKPIPPGSTLRFLSSDRALKVTVLNTPSGIQQPYVNLLGSRKDENGNLSKVMVKARARRERVAVVYKEGDDGIVNGFIQGVSGDTDVFEVHPRKNRVMRKNGEVADQYALPPVPDQQTQVVAIPVEGSIEDYVNRRIPLPCDIPKIKAIYGIDVVQSGRSMINADVMPVQFRPTKKHVLPATIKEWYEKDPKRFFQYIRRTAIMPVHIVAIQTEKIDPADSDSRRAKIKRFFRRK